MKIFQKLLNTLQIKVRGAETSLDYFDTKFVKIGLKKESSDYKNKVRYVLGDCKISH